jgi:hypothetical protein
MRSPVFLPNGSLESPTGSRFDGFVRSPSPTQSSPPSSPTPMRREFSLLNPTTPAKALSDGHKLTDLQNMILDFCYQTVTILNPKEFVLLMKLLDLEGIYYVRLDKSNPLHKSTLQIATLNDFHEFICKLGGRMQRYVFN